MQITGIILAGGQSTRMGTDKALIQINEKTLLENAIDICKPVFSEILVSSNNPDHGKFGAKIIPDEFANCGPLSGIYSCLKKSETDWNFVISVDAAFIELDFIRYLTTQIGDFDAIVPLHDKGKEPLISIYHKNGLIEMQKHLKSGNLKMQNLINAINTKFVGSQKWVEKYPKIFTNLNCPEDL
jgi:molybdopterin-guanine dinucleotide biosynthesis protein A